ALRREFHKTYRQTRARARAPWRWPVDSFQAAHRARKLAPTRRKPVPSTEAAALHVQALRPGNEYLFYPPVPLRRSGIEPDRCREAPVPSDREPGRPRPEDAKIAL